MTKPKQDKTKKPKDQPRSGDMPSGRDKPTIIKTVDNITVYF
jgi:hypothetical protein